jgi:hypothetical protein
MGLVQENCAFVVVFFGFFSSFIACYYKFIMCWDYWIKFVSELAKFFPYQTVLEIIMK